MAFLGLSTAAVSGITAGAAVVGAGAGLASGIYSARAQRQAASQQEQIARYNFAMQNRAAAQQQQLAFAQQQAMMLQAEVMDAQAAIAHALAQSESQARLNNAAALRQSAETQAAVDRQNIMATRRDQIREMAMMRARAAKQGQVAETMSSLDLLAEAAGVGQSILEGQQWESNVGRLQSLAAANLEEFGAELSSANAEAQLGAGRAEADFQRLAAGLEAAKGAMTASNMRKEARFSLLTGEANASGLRKQAFGSLLSGIGSAVGSWASWQNVGGGTGAGSTFTGKLKATA
jgi:hypothetical protein